MVSEMIESFDLRAIGHVDAEIRRIVAARADQLLSALLLNAFQLWSKEKFCRFNDHERSCTVRVFDCCLRVIEASEDDWPQVDVYYDTKLPTMEMRKGDADPLRAPIPDLKFRFGAAHMHIEAKRLHLGDGLPALYVSEGMQRFIDGRYRPNGEPLGAMLGFIFKDSRIEILTAVNSAVAASAAMDPSDELKSLACLTPFVESYEGLHGTGFRLLHYWVEIGSREGK